MSPAPDPTSTGGSEPRGPAAPPASPTPSPTTSTPACTSTGVASIRIQDRAGSSGRALPSVVLADTLSQGFTLATVDNCGNYVNDVSADSWSLGATTYGYLTQSSGPATTFILTRGATPSGLSLSLRATYGAYTATSYISITWSVMNVANLLRWYKTDSFFPMDDGTAVGIASTSEMVDLSGLSSPYNATASTGRNPIFTSTVFSRPSLHLCGGSVGCTGISSNSHLRIAGNYSSFAAMDFTFFFVIARASNTVNYILSNHVNSSNTGTFMGYTSGTNFRLSLAGPGGATAVNATVGAYAGSPVLEIWTARLDTVAGSSVPGLRLYRNAVEVASDATVATQQSTATTFPSIGTQRSDNNSSNFYFSEAAMYSRALTASEMCTVHSYLNRKYALGLTLGCE